MKVIHFKAKYTWCDTYEGANGVWRVDSYPVRTCIMRDNKKIVLEYLDEGVECTFDIKSEDEHNFEGEYYETKRSQNPKGKAIKFKLYKDPTNNKEYFLFGEYAGRESHGYLWIELTVDKIINRRNK